MFVNVSDSKFNNIIVSHRNHSMECVTVSVIWGQILSFVPRAYLQLRLLPLDDAYSTPTTVYVVHRHNVIIVIEKLLFTRPILSTQIVFNIFPSQPLHLTFDLLNTF